MLSLLIDLPARAILGVERGDTALTVHKKWYHFWRLGKVFILPQRIAAWVFGRLTVSEGSEDITYYFR